MQRLFRSCPSAGRRPRRAGSRHCPVPMAAMRSPLPRGRTEGFTTQLMAGGCGNPEVGPTPTRFDAGFGAACPITPHLDGYPLLRV